MSGGRPLFFILAMLCVGALLLVLRHDAASTMGLAHQDFASLLVKLALVLSLSGAVVGLFRSNFPKAVTAALFWIVIALALAVGYAYRQDLKQVGERVLAEISPGRAVSTGGRIPMVEITRTRRGEFQLQATLNGGRTLALLDTGATAVVLTHEAAKAAGLPLELLAYNVPIDTANGRAKAAAVTLDRLAVGPIVERSVPALVAPPGQLKMTLLGMSFLSRLESWEVRGDKLILRGFP